jgi:hypothetical protein
MQFTKNSKGLGILVASGVVLASHWAWADEIVAKATVLSVEGKVLVDGKEISGHPQIAAGSTIETSNGQLTLTVGHDNVMKLTPQSRLRLERLGSGQLSGVLEKGRAEGIRRMELSAKDAKGSTRVGTRSGTFEITGGRYLVEVPKEANGAVQFLAVDGNARVVSGGTMTASAGSGLSMGDGELLLIKANSPGDANGSNRSLASLEEPVGTVIERRTLPQSEMQEALNPIENISPPRTPVEFTRVSSDLPPASQFAPPGFVSGSSILSQPNSLNLNPTQTVRLPRVTVTYVY